MMKKRRRTAIIVCLIGFILIAVITAVSWFSYDKKSYEQSIYLLYRADPFDSSEVVVEYKGEVIDLSGLRITADLIAALVDYPERAFYNGDFGTEDPISITLTGEFSVKIYPNDEESVLIEFRKQNGRIRKYKLSGWRGFYRYLSILYDITGNEVFNETVDLP